MLYMLLLTATVLCLLRFQERYGRRHVGYYVLLCSRRGMVRRAVLAAAELATCGSRPPHGSRRRSALRTAALGAPWQSCGRSG